MIIIKKPMVKNTFGSLYYYEVNMVIVISAHEKGSCIAYLPKSFERVRLEGGVGSGRGRIEGIETHRAI